MLSFKLKRVGVMGSVLYKACICVISDREGSISSPDVNEVR